MSLNYDLSKVKDKDTVCYEQREAHPFYGPAGEYVKPITEHLIWACMGVEMTGITEKDVGEFYTRLMIMYALGYSTHVDGKGMPVQATMQDVIAHIGLSTNVATETRHKWMNRKDGYVQGYMDRRSVEVVKKSKEI